MIPTEEISLKNQFSNSLSLNKEKNLLFFLNTYGSLYSIEIKSMSINWFINLNQSTNISPSSLFLAIKSSTIEKELLYLQISFYT